MMVLYRSHLSIFVTYMVYQGQAINSFQIRHTLGFVTKMFTDFLLCLWPVELKAAAYHQFFSSQCLVPFLTCSLAITRRQNFRTFQIETNCRRHFKM